MMNATVAETLRQLLCSLGKSIRSRVIEGRRSMSTEALSSVANQSAADTIYAIDKFGEEAIRDWFESQWPASEPVEVIMEGPEETLCFPCGTRPENTRWKCLLDPIDGTRGIMYDKRSAWALSGIAPQRGEATRLSDIFVAAMTELPTTKQWRADQASGTRGGGIVAEGCNVLDGSTSPLSRSLQCDQLSTWVCLDGQVLSGGPRTRQPKSRSSYGKNSSASAVTPRLPCLTTSTFAAAVPFTN